MIVTASATAVNQSAKDAIAANIAALVEQLQQGHSEALTAYLTAMGRFHAYSFGNIFEIARQRPDATRVAGFQTWKQFGRYVKKGERGIRIFAPIIGTRERAEEEAVADQRARKLAQVVGFRAVYVFDVSQTEGKDLPELAERVTGSVGDFRDRLFDFIAGQSIEIEFNEGIAPALGASYGGRIALLSGQPAPEEHQPSNALGMRSLPLSPSHLENRCSTRRRADPDARRARTGQEHLLSGRRLGPRQCRTASAPMVSPDWILHWKNSTFIGFARCRHTSGPRVSERPKQPPTRSHGGSGCPREMRRWMLVRQKV